MKKAERCTRKVAGTITCLDGTCFCYCQVHLDAEVRRIQGVPGFVVDWAESDTAKCNYIVMGDTN